MSEIDEIRATLVRKGIPIATKTLEKAVLMPEDQEIPQIVKDRASETIVHSLLKNPFPKAKKKKGKKKK